MGGLFSKKSKKGASGEGTSPEAEETFFESVDDGKCALSDSKHVARRLDPKSLGSLHPPPMATTRLPTSASRGTPCMVLWFAELAENTVEGQDEKER